MDSTTPKKNESNDNDDEANDITVATTANSIDLDNSLDLDDDTDPSPEGIVRLICICCYGLTLGLYPYFVFAIFFISCILLGDWLGPGARWCFFAVPFFLIPFGFIYRLLPASASLIQRGRRATPQTMLCDNETELEEDGVH